MNDFNNQPYYPKKIADELLFPMLRGFKMDLIYNPLSSHITGAAINYWCVSGYHQCLHYYTYYDILDNMNTEFKSQQTNRTELKRTLNKLESKVLEIKSGISKILEKKIEIREQLYKPKQEDNTQLDTIEYYKYLQKQNTFFPSRQWKKA